MKLWIALCSFVFAVTNSDGYIEVSRVQDLYNIRLDLTANYILMNDIDLTEATAKGGEWDFDGDGLVNRKDSLLMKMYLADDSTTIDIQAADVFTDGVVNKKDSLYLKQYLQALM